MKKLFYSSVLLLHSLVIFDMSAYCCKYGNSDRRTWSHGNPNWSGDQHCESKTGWRGAHNHECCAAEYFKLGTTTHSECLEYVSDPNTQIGSDGSGCLRYRSETCPKTYCAPIGRNGSCQSVKGKWTYDDTDLSYRG